MTHTEKTKEQLIAELEQTLQRLSETEAKLHRLSYENEFRKQTLDTLQTPILVLDRDLKVLHANQAAASMARLPLSSLIGISLFGVFPPAIAENIQTKNIKIFATGEPVLGDEESMDLRGKRQWFRMDRYPFYDDQGELSAVLLIAEDITERKQTEQILRESESRYQELTDALPEAMFETDLTGRITYVNKTGLELMGYTQEDFHQGLTLFGMLVPEDLERLKQNWNRLINGQEMESHQYTGLRKDGSTFPVLAYSRLKLQNGQPTGLIGFVVDITEQKQIEAQSMARANDLATVASVSTAISTILDPQQMLETVANLTKERFSLYHAHIYLLNESQDTLLLTAGAGQIGQQMVAEKRSIPLFAEKSIVARTARLRSGNIVNDVRSDPEFLPHPLLPNTAAELAVPLIVGDKLLGVLDVQSEQMNRFTDDDINILTTLGSQIAVALQNARQYSQLQQSERLTRAIIDATPDWIFIRDREHRYQLVNNGYAHDMNMDPADILGKTDRDLGLPEELLLGDPKTGRSGFWQQDDRVIEVGQSLTFPNESITMNGQTRIFNMIKTPVRDEQGNITGVLAFGRDVTEREGLFEESQRLFEAGQRINTATDIQEMISGMMHGVDIPDVNRAVVFLFEYDEQGEVTTLEVAGNWYSGEGHQPTPVGMRFGIHDLRPQAVKQMVTTEPIFLNETDQLTQQRNILSMAVVPLFASGKQIGSILLETERFHTFTENEIRPVLSMSQQLATAIQNRVLMQKLSQALSQAQRNQVFLRTLLDTIPNPIFFKDTQGRYIASNKAFQDYIGLTEEELTNKTIFDLQPDRTKSERYDQIDRDLFENPGTQTYEVRVKYADGIFRDVIFNKTTFFNPDGSVAGLVGVMVDISDRKQAEQALLTSQAQLTQALQIAQMGYWEFDFATQTFTLGQQYMHLLGVKTEGSVTYPVDEFSTRFVHSDDVALVFATIQQAIASTDPDYAGELEVRLRHTSGHYINTVARFTIQRDETGHALKAIGSSQDITERKAAEEAIRQSEARFRTLLQAVPDMIFRLDDQDVFIDFKPGRSQTYLPPELFLGKHYTEVLPPFVTGIMGQAMHTCRETGQPQTIEYELPYPDGRPGYYEMNVVAGEQGQVISVVRDITQSKLDAQAIAARAAELATVAEVATTTATILDPQELLLQVVNLTKERFNLYHAHIYLLDESGQNLVLAVGAGEAGRQMVAQGWQIPLNRERSLVARTAREQKGALVNDVRAEPDFLPNPLLPNTAAELAVPLITSGRVLGVLDVQSEQIGRFGQEDINVLTILGAQIAVALDNARRYTQLRQSEQLTRTIIDATPDWIFIKDLQHRYRLANRGYANDLHLSPEDFIGKDDLELGFPEELVRGNPEKGIRGFWADDRLVFETGEPQLYPNEPVVVDNEPRILNTLKTPLRDEHGNIWGVLAFGRDVTERERLLQESSRLYETGRRLVTAASYQDLIEAVMYGVDIPAVNRAVLMLLQYENNTPSTLQVVANWHNGKGHKPTRVGAQIHRSEMGETFESLLCAEPVFINETNPETRKQGIASMAILPLWSAEKQIGVLLFETEEAHTFTEAQIRPAVSVSQQLAVSLQNRILLAELSQALSEAQRNQVFLRTLLDNIPNPVFFKDTQGRYIGFNKAFQDYIGLTEEQLLGKSVFDLQTDQKLAEKYHQMDVALFKNPGTQVYESRVKYADGSFHDVIFNKATYFNPDGSLAGLVGVIVDITDRKQAEQALLTSQAQLTQALEIAQMGYWEFDFAAQTFTLSQQYMHLLGVKTEGSVTYPVDEFSTRFVHPDDVALVFSTIQQAIVNTDPDYAGELEVRLRHTNGHYINTVARFTIQRDETGHALKAIGSSQDITERKAAEEAIRQSEARFRTLLQAVPDMIFRLDDQDVFIDFKPGRSQTYLPPELFLGKHYTEVLPPFVTGIMGQAMHTCRETGQPQTIEYELPYPDGRPGYYEMNVVAGEQGQVISVVRDITQSKLDAQAIAARAVELATVAEVSTAVSTILDPNQMLQTVVNLTKERFNLYHAHIYLFDPADNTLNLAVGAGEIGQQMVAEKRFIPLAAEKSLVARTARERVGLIVNDVHADPDFLPHPLLPDTAAEMTAPIVVGDKLLGVLDVQSSESNRFTQENADILTTLAAQIGVALQNDRLFITSQSLYRTSQRISAANSADEMLKAIVDAFDIPTLQQTGAAFILQLQRDPTTNEPESAKVLSNWYGTEAIPTIPVGTIFPKAMFSSLKLMLSPSPIFFNDALHDERIDPNSKALLQQNNAASAAVLPLWIGNEQLGSIVIQTVEPHAFTEEQIQSYPVLASQLAIALQTRLLLDELQSSQQQLTQALQIARLAYWQFDVAQGLFTFNDDYYTNILHTTVEQMGGYNIPAAQFATLVHPDDRADVPIQIQKAIETTDPDYSSIFESRLICPDGVERVIQARIRILKDANGVTTTLYGINQDVTERVIAEQQIARQATQLATVANVSNIIASILDPDQMLQTVVELTKSRFGLYHVHIYLLENDGETLRLKAGAGEIGQQLLAQKHALQLTSEVSLVARCARTQQIVVVNDVSKSPDYLAHPLLPNTQSELVIPLLIGNQLLGILDVQAEQINAFSESDANILATLASQVAVSLQNARSFARIQSQAEREALLNTISQQIQSTTTIEAALQVAIREIGRAVGAKRTSVLLDLPQKPTSSDPESGNA